MRLLLDILAFLWWLAGNEALSVASRTAIADENDDVYLSAVSAWEISTKHRPDKLPGVAAIVTALDATTAEQHFIGLPVSILRGQTGGALLGAHRRLLSFSTLEGHLYGSLILGNSRGIQCPIVGHDLLLS